VGFSQSLGASQARRRYFQLRNSGLQNQDVLHVLEALDTEARVLLDQHALG
jgi:hypothetical protein